MADIGNIQMYEEYHDVKPYIVEVEIRAYRQINVQATSIEEPKVKASEEFSIDPWIDELRDWRAVAVLDGNTNQTLWLEKGD